MDKSKSSVSKMGKKENAISNVMNLPVSLTSMLTCGHKTRGIGHFSLSFLEIGSTSIVTSLAKCLGDLEELMVDNYRDLL